MKSSQGADGLAATALSIFTLVIGATTVFAALEAALQQIWGARALAPKGIYGWIRARILSFGLILAIGFLLLVSLSLSTAIAALRDIVAKHFSEFVALMAALDFAVSLALVTGLIAVIYRYMPAKHLAWRPILWGALVTALLFQLGRWGISFYLGRSTQPTAFGAAASFAALLLWLYYSAQIFLLGAEFTACLGGSRDSCEGAGSTQRSFAMNTTAIFRRHKWLWAFVFLVLLLVVARASLPSIVKDTVNEKLMALPAYDGQVDDVDLALWRGAYRIEGIRIVKTGSKEPTPFFDGERIDFSIEWRSLLKGSLVSECEMWRPKVNLVQAESEQQSQLGKEVNWADGLERLFPFRFNTIHVLDGTVTFRAPGIRTQDALEATHVNGAITNMTNVVESGKATFAGFQATAEMLDTGTGTD